MAGFSFGSTNNNTKPATGNTGFSFGSTNTTQNPAPAATSGFSFGSTNTNSNQSAAQATTAGSSGFSFGSTNATAANKTPATNTGFSFGATNTANASQPQTNASSGFSFGASNTNAARPAGTASATSGFSFGNPANSSTSNTQNNQLKEQFDFTTGAVESKATTDSEAKNSLGGISIIKPSDADLINKHRTKLGNELLPNELIRSTHELEKSIIKCDQASIYLQNAFNLQSAHAQQKTQTQGMLRSLALLEEMDKTCDLLLEKCTEQQNQIDSTASKLGDQHSILSVASRRMGISDLTSATQSDSLYGSQSIYNIAQNQLIDVDLGKVVDSYLSSTLHNANKALDTSNQSLEAYSALAKTLLYSNDESEFMNHSLHQIQGISAKLAAHQQVLEARQLTRMYKQHGQSDLANNSSNSIQKHLNSIFNQGDGNNAIQDVEKQKRCWWKDSLGVDEFKTFEGPTPFVSSRSVLDGDQENKKSTKHVTFA